MTGEPIYIGQWVELNSGSPPLFVAHAYDDQAIVVWINAENTPEELTISQVCLKPWVFR